MKKAQILFAVIAIIVAVLGFPLFGMMIMESNGAPQEAAAAAIYLALVVPFYVVARCVEMLYSSKRDRQPAPQPQPTSGEPARQPMQWK